MIPHDQAMWGSHLPALVAAISASTGPVLELGVGHFSTPALHAVCGALNRRLVSVEENSEWCDRFKKFETSWHRVDFHSNQEFFEIMQDHMHGGKWGVAFIDSSPGGLARAVAFKALIDCSAYVVVHDYHLENFEHIAPLLAGLKSVYVTTHQQPPTLIASRDFELPNGLEEL